MAEKACQTWESIFPPYVSQKLMLRDIFKKSSKKGVHYKSEDMSPAGLLKGKPEGEHH